MREVEDKPRTGVGIEPVQAGTFEPFIGRSVRFAGSDIVLVLDRVERAGASLSNHMARDPFTLIFSGPRERTYLPEGVYRCDFGGDAADGPAFDIHVAPIHTVSADRQDYQAVFN